METFGRETRAQQSLSRKRRSWAIKKARGRTQVSDLGLFGKSPGRPPLDTFNVGESLSQVVALFQQKSFEEN
jgi:hypothetical protein